MSLVGNGIKSEETGKSSITRAFTSLFLGIRAIQIKGNWGKGTLSTGPKFSVNRLSMIGFDGSTADFSTI